MTSGEWSCSPSTSRDGVRILAAATPPPLDEHPGNVSADFEHLRWFDLPKDAVASL